MPRRNSFEESRRLSTAKGFLGYRVGTVLVIDEIHRYNKRMLKLMASLDDLIGTNVRFPLTEASIPKNPRLDPSFVEKRVNSNILPIDKIIKTETGKIIYIKSPSSAVKPKKAR